ncbi:MAG: hypothetical protein Q6373_010125 [Candidatus Sigynarchaeota archaeon]
MKDIDNNQPGSGSKPDPKDPFDEEVKERLTIRARLDLQREMANRMRRDRERRALIEAKQREQALLPEKLDKATQILDIAHQFWKRDVFPTILDFFKRGRRNPMERRFFVSSYRYRNQDFLRWWYRVYDRKLVIWCKENQLTDERKLLALGEDGGLLYVDAEGGRPAGRGDNEMWFYTAADMARALRKEQIDEIHATFSMQTIEDLVKWQMDEEIHRNRGKIVRGDVQPGEDDDVGVEEGTFFAYDIDEDDEDDL